MSDHSISPLPAAYPNAGVSRRSKFFVVTAGVMLLVVLAGFGPTLFFRPYFDVPEIPDYLLVHGAVLTTWFVWFFIQATFAFSGRTDIHRRLGVVGITIGAVVIIAGFMATFGFIPRLTALGRDLDSNIAWYAGVVWSNLGMGVLFAVLLLFAVLNRRRPEYHKRLMLLASISILGPALGRLARYPALRFSDTQMVNEFTYGLGGLLVFLLALVAYDIVVTKRPHRVTLVGAPVVLLSPAIFGLLVANSLFGRALVPLIDNF